MRRHPRHFKHQVAVKLPEFTHQLLTDFRKKQGLESNSEACRELLAIGLLEVGQV